MTMLGWHLNLLHCFQIGPRMTLQLTKIQEGMGEGNVLYHNISECTPPFISLSA